MIEKWGPMIAEKPSGRPDGRLTTNMDDVDKKISNRQIVDKARQLAEEHFNSQQ